ncbi:hypothetical protein PG999_001875 [Apiospora kogelbergensis]|uniref:Amine oxidase domain-containing protein n=1 Tax=Apiospora kogelbergensis TaxID=1337665 RepID=A0AAW0R6S1_9PEZI
MRSLTTLALSASLAYAYPAAPGCWSKHAFAASDILQRDVLVVGGGATGTFAAVKLKDAGKTVAVVERADRLGGHVDTFYDPASGLPVDYGVQGYFNNKQTQDFFAKFGVALTTVTGSPFPQKVADFSNGFIVPNATLRPLMAKYAQVLATNFPYLGKGTYDLPDPVPQDLLLPFGAFVAKYNLTETIPLVWSFAQGVGNLLEANTLHVLQNFGLSHVLALQGGLQVAQAGNQVVYNKAAAFLGDEALLYNSTVLQLARSDDDGVTAVINTAAGAKLVHAKKLLVTIPPTLGNLGKFDLDTTEETLFGQWANVPYFIGVLAKTGLTDRTSFLNVNLSSADTLPRAPLVWRIETVGVPGYHITKVIGEKSSQAAQRLVTDAATRIDRSLQTTAATEFVRWMEHENLQLHVSPEALSQGFYKQLYGCQGKRSTWYTGNAWATDYSSLLWAFTEERILPSLL